MTEMISVDVIVLCGAFMGCAGGGGMETEMNGSPLTAPTSWAADSLGVPGHVTGAASSLPDTIQLPRTWPQAFPSPPPGGQFAGVSEVPAEALRGARGDGPYHIAFVLLPEGMREGFRHYRDALEEADWEILEPLTHDGSRVGRPTIGFRGHGYAGDIRFEEALDMVLATIHLYAEPPSGIEPLSR